MAPRTASLTPALTLLLAARLLSLATAQLPHTIDLTWFQPLEGWSLPEPVQYKFTEFPHFETRKNEALFREYVKACEQSPACWAEPYTASSAERTACVRACISQACYTQVYGEDPLEEGEIDVRLNSFKGCFHQALERRRRP